MIDRAPHLLQLATIFILVAFLSCGCLIRNAEAAKPPVQEALIITVQLTTKFGSPTEMKRLFKLEDEVTKAIDRSQAGEYDGNDVGDGTFNMYAYGPSADKLFDVVQPILKKYQLPAGSRAVKRYGKPGAKEESISISADNAE